MEISGGVSMESVHDTTTQPAIGECKANYSGLDPNLEQRGRQANDERVR